MAGALSRPALLALRVWRSCGFRNCAIGFAAADDCLFSPAVARVVTAEYHRECFTRGVGRCGRWRFAALASECGVVSTAIQTCRRDQLVDGTQRRSLLKIRLGCIQVTRIFRSRRVPL